MFNGIVYNQGLIKKIYRNPKYVNGSRVVEMTSDISFKQSDVGESVCCDGVCLTLIRIKKKSQVITFKVMLIQHRMFKALKLLINLGLLVFL